MAAPLPRLPRRPTSAGARWSPPSLGPGQCERGARQGRPSGLGPREASRLSRAATDRVWNVTREKISCCVLVPRSFWVGVSHLVSSGSPRVALRGQRGTRVGLVALWPDVSREAILGKHRSWFTSALCAPSAGGDRRGQKAEVRTERPRAGPCRWHRRLPH